MNTAIRLVPAESVPEDGVVRHIDELSESAQGVFPALASGVPGQAVLDEPTARKFVDGEYVKFTTYYRVTVEA